MTNFSKVRTRLTHELSPALYLISFIQDTAKTQLNYIDSFYVNQRLDI